MFVVQDPSGLAGAALSISQAALQVLALLDGTRTPDQILNDFAQATGQRLSAGLLDQLLDKLDQAHFLEGPVFEAHYHLRVEAYQSAPTRKMQELSGAGLDEHDVPGSLKRLFAWQDPPAPRGHLRGLVAPHLDYPRGQPCYHKAYAELSAGHQLQRFVILGTNHFGRSNAVVATAKDLETPLGVCPVDRDFLERLEQRCGTTLRQYELDHGREHSIELQVLLLQHRLEQDGFTVVPLLCPSPCGPTGTAPIDGQGVDLKDFGEALAALLEEDPAPTCLIASADLSHVGGYFGDSESLSEAFLERVRESDARVLDQLARNDAEQLRAQVAGDDNPTRICSAGCLYTLMTALPGTQVELLEYHQAVNQDVQNTVTCAAAVFWAP